MKLTIPQFKTILEKTGLPVSYNVFETAPPLPYVTYRVTSEPSFFADNVVYNNSTNLEVELYTSKKSLTTEETLRDVLLSHDIRFESIDEWLDEERVYRKLYEVRL